MAKRTMDPIQTLPAIQQLKTRKRRREDERPPPHETSRPTKRARTSVVSVDKPGDSEPIKSESNYIEHWAEEGNWPSTYFNDDNTNHLLARESSIAPLTRKRSSPSIAGSSASDERPREEKSAPYRNPSYPAFLSEDVDNYKSYMEDHEEGISQTSEKLLEILLNTEQNPPTDTLFDDTAFSKFLRKLKGKNESRVIQDLSPLLVPSVEALAILGHRLTENAGKIIQELYSNLFPSLEALTSFSTQHLDRIVESVNEGWNNCYPITKPRPQPDSAFAYGVSAFSDDQFNILRPTLGDATFRSMFKTTWYGVFAFLTKEVKTGIMGLDIADNQNLHSITIAVRAVVELFKLVGREKELHREIVAFSISHDDKSVRLYAHYPYIDGDKVSIWRRTVDQYYLKPNNKWICRTFTTNIYDMFSLIHLKRIYTAIDDIPARKLETQSSESVQQLDNPSSTTESSGLSQPFEHQRLHGDSVVPDSQQPRQKEDEEKEW
ncbi:hypothetical protein ACMFMG_008568 [Clarireedia jacksonii]